MEIREIQYDSVSWIHLLQLTRSRLQITTHHSNDGPYSSVTEPVRWAAVGMISQRGIT
jgi:hypothetical protein